MKKKISILLCTCIMISSFSVSLPAYAQTATTEASAIANELEEPNVDKLTEITTYVKSVIPIPKSLTEFEYNYDSGSSVSTPTWTLNWQTPDGSQRIRVNCDSNKNISRYYINNSEGRKYKPTHLKKELKTKADMFISKVSPQIFGKLEYIENEPANVYSGTYSFLYRRVENKIPMPDNTVTVSVNYETGEVTNYNANWLYNAVIPSPAAKITKEEATQKIGSELNMALTYQTPYSGASKQAYLVYQPDRPYISVDAITGKVYLTKQEWYEENSSTAESVADKATGGSLTPKEVKSISKLKNLISQTAAIEAVKNEKNLYLDQDCTSVSAALNLATDGYNSDNKIYIWEIRFTDGGKAENDGKSSYIPYANASVDATDGKILSYHAAIPEYYDSEKEKWENVNVKYTSKECAPIFEAFVKSQKPEYFNNAKQTASGNDYLIGYKNDAPVYGGYNYNYTRINESVLYPSNGFYGSVDGITGKIYSFRTNWNKNITFQSTKGIMDKAKAFDQYISKDGFGLIYEINTLHNEKDGSVKNEIRLVYSPDIKPSTISPFTGKQLDYSGKPITTQNGTYAYSDISNSKNKRAILLLADLGLGFEGGKFQPNKKITGAELESLMPDLPYSLKKLTDKEKKQTITRMNGVKYLISYANLDKVAKLKNIYTADFKDKNKISKVDMGYAALAKGLGIVKDSSFRGDEMLTRGEAAQMIINLLKADY